MSTIKKRKITIPAKNLTIGIGILSVIMLLIGGYLGYMVLDKYKIGGGTIANQNVLSDEEIDEVVDALKKNIIIPSEETPVVALITDVEILIAEQEFYQGAENGDFVIVYPDLERAFVFSLKRDLIINVGPVQFDDSLVESEVTTSASSEEIQEKSIFGDSLDEILPEEDEILE